LRAGRGKYEPFKEEEPTFVHGEVDHCMLIPRAKNWSSPREEGKKNKNTGRGGSPIQGNLLEHLAWLMCVPVQEKQGLQKEGVLYPRRVAPLGRAYSLAARGGADYKAERISASGGGGKKGERARRCVRKCWDIK